MRKYRYSNGSNLCVFFLEQIFERQFGAILTVLLWSVNMAGYNDPFVYLLKEH